MAARLLTPVLCFPAIEDFKLCACIQIDLRKLDLVDDEKTNAYLLPQLDLPFVSAKIKPGILYIWMTSVRCHSNSLSLLFPHLKIKLNFEIVRFCFY